MAERGPRTQLAASVPAGRQWIPVSRTRTVALGLLACVALSCGGGYRVVVKFSPTDLASQVRRVEVSLVTTCNTAAIRTGQPVAAIRTIDLTPSASGTGLGAVPPGSYGLYARGFDASCGVVAVGCMPVTLAAGGSGDQVVTVIGIAGPRGCPSGLLCADGSCLSPDAGARDGAEEAGPVCQCAACASCDCTGACVPDSTACPAGDYCDPTAGCMAGTPCPLDGGSCPDDGNPCTSNTCDTSRTPSICAPRPVGDGSSCSSGGAAGQCRSGECCTGCWFAGACMPGNTVAVCGTGGAICNACDDGDPCTTDTCTSAKACQSVPDDTATCPGGACHAGVCCTGCWDGSTCQAGTTNAVCGTGGGDCATCGGADCPSSRCTGGMCIARGAKALGAGPDHFCAVATDGSLWCWGSNAAGALGDGTTTERDAPVAVSSMSGPSTATWTAVAGGGSFTCGLQTGGSVWCWGDNRSGQLGNGTTAGMSPFPAEVGTADGFLSVVSSYHGSCAIAADRLLECWGGSGHGEARFPGHRGRRAHARGRGRDLGEHRAARKPQLAASGPTARSTAGGATRAASSATARGWTTRCLARSAWMRPGHRWRSATTRSPPALRGSRAR